MGSCSVNEKTAAGSQQVSFEIGTAYEPGEYTVVALSGDETLLRVHQ